VLTRKPSSQRAEQLGRPFKPLDCTHIRRLLILAHNRGRGLARASLFGLKFTHRRISLPRTGEDVEKIRGHAATSTVDVVNNPTYGSRPPTPPINPLNLHPANHQNGVQIPVIQGRIRAGLSL